MKTYKKKTELNAGNWRTANRHQSKRCHGDSASQTFDVVGVVRRLLELVD